MLPSQNHIKLGQMCWRNRECPVHVHIFISPAQAPNPSRPKINILKMLVNHSMSIVKEAYGQIKTVGSSKIQTFAVHRISPSRIIKMVHNPHCFFCSDGKPLGFEALKL